MVVKGQRIYISNKNCLDHALECDVEKIDNQGRIHFDVVNGMWDGYFDPTQEIVYVKYTREKYPSEIIYAGPRIKGADYNERINGVLQLVRENGIVPPAGITATRHTSTGSMQDVSLRTEPSDTRHAATSQSGNVRANLRTVKLQGNSYLVVDQSHSEVRLFRKDGHGRKTKNTMVRSMSLAV